MIATLERKKKYTISESERWIEIRLTTESRNKMKETCRARVFAYASQDREDVSEVEGKSKTRRLDEFW